MKARELMTSDPFVITPGDSVYRAAEMMRDLEVGLLPVVDSPSTMKVRGVITDRDIATRCVAQRHSGECPVSQHMTPAPLATIAPDADIHSALALMESKQVRRLLVVSAGDKLEGVIAQADVATKLGRSEPLEVEQLLEAVSSPAPAVA